MPHNYPSYNRSRGKKRPAHTRYAAIWLTALLIFALTFALLRTGLGEKLENALAAAALDDILARSVINLVLPEAQTEPAATLPVLASEPAQTPPDEPELSEQVFSPEDLQEATPTMYEPPVFESVIPGIDSAAVSGDSVASLTIDGVTGGYESAGPVYIRNETKYTIDMAALLKRKSPVKLSGSGAQVLIMHTHGTEAYTPDATHRYEASDPDRTINPERNMLRVGDEIAAILEQNGISVLHSTALNDYPAYNGSYNRALEDIKKFLKENPSIKVVIDVHRDAMISQNGTKYKTVATIDGKSAAQLMFVVGTNEGGLSHDNWRDNLTFQAQLQQRLNDKYPGIMRPMSIRTGRFNQHVTTGSMLLEVGTSGNSLSEALYSAQLFAQELADKLNGK